MTGVVVEAREIAVCHTAEGFRAIGDICPHAGGSLSQGALHGEMVVCPWHAWEFNCVTGENDFDPSVRIPTYPVVVEDGFVSVDADARTA